LEGVAFPRSAILTRTGWNVGGGRDGELSEDDEEEESEDDGDSEEEEEEKEL
jgi:hypothetical protein